MSSEVYARWRVRDTKMLHEQLMERLATERRHQAELLKKVSSDVESINQGINDARQRAEADKKESVPVATVKLNGLNSTKSSEIVSEGLSESFDEKGVSVVTESGKRKLVEVDLSQMLCRAPETSDKSRKTAYAMEISALLSNAVIETKDELALFNAFVTYLNELLNDEELGFDYFKSLVDVRLKQLREQIEFIYSEDTDDTVVEYYAMCKLMNREPLKIRKEKMKKEIEIMEKEYLVQQEEGYVFENLREVFAELHMSIEGEMELDGLPGVKVSDSSIPGCSVFMSIDGRGVLFETFAEVDGDGPVSADKKAYIEGAARSYCKKQKAVIDKMRERGIELVVECDEKPNADQIIKKKKGSTKSKGRVAKTKAKAMEE